MKSICFSISLLLVLLNCIHLSVQNCSPSIHLERTNSTIFFCDVATPNTTFVLSMSPNNTVDWTLEGKRYKVLGSEECLPGQGYIYDGVNHVCDPDFSKTSDRLGQLLPLCAGSNNVPVWNGTAWVCSYDYDYLSALAPNCTNGQTVKSTGPFTWACADDQDTLARIAKCGAGVVPVFHNGTFQCAVNFTTMNQDTLRDLRSNCTNGYIPKYINGHWQCAPDNDFLGSFSCPLATPILVRATNNTWGCGVDHDTFRDLTFNCSTLPTGFDTPVLTPTGWTCKPVPTFNQSAAIGTVLYSDTYYFFSSGLQQTFDAYFFPIVTPYNGTLKAFSIRPVILDGVSATISAAVTVNGNQVPSSLLSGTFQSSQFLPYGITDLTFPISYGSSIAVNINSTGALVIITADIYLQLNTLL